MMTYLFPGISSSCKIIESTLRSLLTLPVVALNCIQGGKIVCTTPIYGYAQWQLTTSTCEHLTMSHRPDTYTFQRYLSAKRTIDDRALNCHVWETLHDALVLQTTADRPLTILEIGGGIGTMVERLLEEGRLPTTSYHLVDEQAENIATASSRLQSQFPAARPLQQFPTPFNV